MSMTHFSSWLSEHYGISLQQADNLTVEEAQLIGNVATAYMRMAPPPPKKETLAQEKCCKTGHCACKLSCECRCRYCVCSGAYI